MDRIANIDWRLYASWALALLIVWPLQYLIVVPSVLLWRGVKIVVSFAVKLGAIGFLLLFLPVIGWAILVAWLLFRRPDHHADLIRDIDRARNGPKRSVFEPWHVGVIALVLAIGFLLPIPGVTRAGCAPGRAPSSTDYSVTVIQPRASTSVWFTGVSGYLRELNDTYVYPGELTITYLWIDWPHTTGVGGADRYALAWIGTVDNGTSKWTRIFATDSDGFASYQRDFAFSPAHGSYTHYEIRQSSTGNWLFYRNGAFLDDAQFGSTWRGSREGVQTQIGNRASQMPGYFGQRWDGRYLTYTTNYGTANFSGASYLINDNSTYFYGFRETGGTYQTRLVVFDNYC